MRSDPVVGVVCDVCGTAEIEVGITATARGYDERNMDDDIRRHGWVVFAGQDVCEDCVEREKVEEAMDADLDLPFIGVARALRALAMDDEFDTTLHGIARELRALAKEADLDLPFIGASLLNRLNKAGHDAVLRTVDDPLYGSMWRCSIDGFFHGQSTVREHAITGAYLRWCSGRGQQRDD
jgi:hypothetical protein